MTGVLRTSEAVVNIVATVRSPDGTIKGTVTLVGTTELPESDLRSALNVKENSDGSDPRNGD